MVAEVLLEPLLWFLVILEVNKMTNDLIALLEPFVQKGLKMGADEVELFAQKIDSKETNFEANNLKSATANTIEGVGIRVLKGHSLGFASVNSFNKRKITQGLKEAYAIAKVAPPEKHYSLPPKQKVKSIPELYDETAEQLSVDDTISLGQQLLEGVKEYDSRISVDSGSFEVTIRQKAIVNSNDIAVTEKKSMFSFGIFGMAIDGDDVGSFTYEYDSVVKKKDVNIEQVASEFAAKALNNLGAQKTEAFVGPAILTPDAAADLLYMIIYSTKASTIQQGSSYLSDKLGDKIAVDEFTIVDDGTMKNNTGSSSFDREGVPHKELVVIDEGTFTGIFYDTFTANKEKLKSTGHASGDFRSIPNIETTNLNVQPGKRSIDDLITEIDHGIVVQRISASPDPISGDFSGAIKGGKLIKKGEKTTTLKEVTAVGNVFELLQSITGISKEQKPLRGTTNWFIPFLVVDDIKFVT
ncbi:MAG: hypothetical protein GF308_19645 [Candidatus Heimdallarchaeota archaeon]|nr:hypothetical protein [Candidatus Heimdallarchaeota archaeon]